MPWDMPPNRHDMGSIYGAQDLPLWLQSGIQEAPPPVARRPGAHLYEGVKNMRSVGIGETIANALLPRFDEQGAPQAPGPRDFVSAALMAMPGPKLPRSIITPNGTSISGPGATFFSAKNEAPSEFYYLARRPGMDRDMVVKVDKGNWDAPTHNNEVNWSFADQFKKYPDIWNDVGQYHAAEGAAGFNREPFRALHDVIRTDAGIRQPSSYVYKPAQEAFRDTNSRQRIYEMMMRKEFPGWQMEPLSGGRVRVITGHAPEAGNFNYAFKADRPGGRDVNAILNSLLSGIK